jgi:hypothetical protein
VIGNSRVPHDIGGPGRQLDVLRPAKKYQIVPHNSPQKKFKMVRFGSSSLFEKTQKYPINMRVL